MDDQAKSTRWALVKDRFARLQATSWPVPPKPAPTGPEAEALADQRNAAKWQEILKPWAALECPETLRDHLNLLAYRFTRLLVMASQTIPRLGLLSQVPGRPNAWALPLPAQEHPVHIPGGLSLDPRQCDPTLFGSALLSSIHLFSSLMHSPLHMVAQWLLEDLPDRLYVFWPRPPEITSFERDLVYWTQNMVTRKGRAKAMAAAQDKFDLSAEETAILCNQSLATFREIGKIDPDIERGLLLTRLEDYLQRMRKKSLDPKNEFNAMKLHAAIAGLTRATPSTDRNEDNLDMIDVIAEMFKPPAPKLPHDPV